MDDGCMYALLCILDDASLIQIHQRLNANSMEFSFLRDTIITNPIEKGRLQAWVDISTKGSHSLFFLILHKNTSLIGDLKVGNKENEKQDRIHGYPSRVWVGRGCI